MSLKRAALMKKQLGPDPDDDYGSRLQLRSREEAVDVEKEEEAVEVKKQRVPKKESSRGGDGDGGPGGAARRPRRAVSSVNYSENWNSEGEDCSSDDEGQCSKADRAGLGDQKGAMVCPGRLPLASRGNSVRLSKEAGSFLMPPPGARAKRKANDEVIEICSSDGDEGHDDDSSAGEMSDEGDEEEEEEEEDYYYEPTCRSSSRHKPIAAARRAPAQATSGGSKQRAVTRGRLTAAINKQDIEAVRPVELKEMLSQLLIVNNRLSGVRISAWQERLDQHIESLPALEKVMRDLVGVPLPDEVLARVLPTSSRVYDLLRDEAGRRGWQYGRPNQLPLQHRVVLAVASLVLPSLQEGKSAKLDHLWETHRRLLSRVDDVLADALPDICFFDTVYLSDVGAITERLCLTAVTSESLRHPDGYHPLLDKIDHHKLVSIARVERWLQEQHELAQMLSVVSALRVLDELRVSTGGGKMRQLGAYAEDHSLMVWGRDGSLSTKAASTRFDRDFSKTRVIPQGNTRNASTCCDPVIGAVVLGAAERLHGADEVVEQSEGGEEEEDAWHGIAEAHPAQAKREAKACVDNSTGLIFLSSLSERTSEDKKAKKEARDRGEQHLLSPAAAKVVAIISTSKDALPTHHDITMCSHRLLAPLTRKALELGNHIDLSNVSDYEELKRRTRMVALWVFFAHPPQPATHKRRRGTTSQATVRLTYSGVSDLAITYPSIEQQGKMFIFDEFLNCDCQPLILRGDPRLLLREDTREPYFDDMSSLLHTRAALIFVSPQSRREDHGGLFAAVDSRGISLPKMASLDNSTQWTACEVKVPGREEPVTICVEVVGEAADDNSPLFLLPADAKGRYGVVLTRDRVRVDKGEFDMQNGRNGGTASQDIVRKVAKRPDSCTEEEKEKAEKIKLTVEDQRRGGQWERTGAKTQGLGKGIRIPHLLLKCENKEDPCEWQIRDRRDQASSACRKKCKLQPEEICPRHVRTVSHVARLKSCTHGRHDYNGQVAARSDAPFPGVPFADGSYPADEDEEEEETGEGEDMD